MPSTATRSAPSTADQIGQFFGDLAAFGHLATLERESATLRFDVPGDAGRADRWHISVRDGDVSVSRQGNGTPDAIITIPRPAAEALVTGRLNAHAALLRGLLKCEGSIAACMMFQRCLPGPPGSVGRVPPISSATVMAWHDGTKGRRT